MRTTVLHRGELSVVDYRCDAEQGEPPFQEVHTSHALSYVRTGSFGYQVAGSAHELVSGSLLVGFPGQSYACTHPHAAGDECLAFELSPALVDALGGSEAAWRAASLPPLAELVVLGELAQAAASGQTDISVEEVGLLLASRFVTVVTGRRGAPPATGPRGSTAGRGPRCGWMRTRTAGLPRHAGCPGGSELPPLSPLVLPARG